MPLKGKDPCPLRRGANSLFLGSFFSKSNTWKVWRLKVKESHLFQIKLPHLFADITVRCFQKIKSSTYSHQPFEGISKKNPLGFLGKGIPPPRCPNKNIQGQWTPRNMSPSPPSHFGRCPKPAISEVGTFERIALHSTFVRGDIRGFRMFSGETKLVAVEGVL